MSDSLFCPLDFGSTVQLHDWWANLASQRAFLPWPEASAPEIGAELVVLLTIRGEPQIELSCLAEGSEVDAAGQVGIFISVADESLDRLTQMLAREAPSPSPSPSPSSSSSSPPSSSPSQASRGPDEAAATRVSQGGKFTDVGGETAQETGAPSLVAPGTILEGRYRVEGHLATGGMGEVYRAVHVHLKRPIALKLLRRAFAGDADMWARFKREAELVSRLESPHIVRVFDFGRTAEGEAFLAMELVEGARLDELLERGPLEPRRTVRLLAQVLEGLEEAHALGIIHRDLKPPNIMVGRKRDGSEVAKILDFGIARLADGRSQQDATITQMGVVVGTPAYLAPEQALAADLDARTDLYAVGCVAFELLCGRPPFVAENLAKVISMHLTAAPPAMESLRPELAAWPALTAAVRKALAKERELRFQSAAEFLAALESAAGSGAGAATAAGTSAGAPPPPEAGPAAIAAEWGPATTPRPSAPPAPAATARGASAASFAAEWGPPRVARAQVPAGVAPAPAPVDDFFASVGFTAPRDGATRQAGVPNPSGEGGGSATGRLSAALAAVHLRAPSDLVGALESTRAALEGRTLRLAVARVEVLGPPHGSALHEAAIELVLRAVHAFRGVVEAVDEDGLGLVFGDESSTAALARGLRALEQARDAVAELGARSGPQASAALRAGLVHGGTALEPGLSPGGALPGKAQALMARFPAGTVAVDRAAAEEVADLAELRSSPGVDGLELGPRRSQLKRVEPPLVGREALLQSLDRRLAALPQGVVAPLVVRGPSGSGRSAIAEELVTRARQRGVVAAIARGAASLQAQPWGALTELLCHALGVPTHERATALQPALDSLALEPRALEAVRVLTGLSQVPVPMTAGQAVHALRVALRAGAGERPLLLVFDSLETVDARSLEGFHFLVRSAAARELTVGFSTETPSQDVLGTTPIAELGPLAANDVTRWLLAALEGTPPPELLETLNRLSGGLAGRLVDWVSYLDDTGLLRRHDGKLSLDGAPPELAGEALLEARLDALPLDARRLLEAAAICGDTVEASAMQVACPRAGPSAFQRAALARLLRSVGSRRWTLASPRVRAALVRTPSLERPSMHSRLAAGLILQAKANPATVDTLRIAQHLNAARDGARAAPLWKHATEAALSRRALRDAVACTRGWSEALGLMRSSDSAVLRARVDGLARAACIALSLQDAALARTVVDEATTLATPSGLNSAELSLALAGVQRTEARRAKAAEALAVAAQLAQGHPLAALVEAERGEAREQEGDLAGALAAYESALTLAPAARDLSRWHGEIDLSARLEARLGGLALQRKDFTAAQQRFESSLEKWRHAAWPFAEARVLANLGTTCVLMKDSSRAPAYFSAAAQAAARCGDLLFQARMLLQQAKAAKLTGEASAARAIASEARKLCGELDWGEGRSQAEALASS